MDPELSLVLACYNEAPWLDRSVRTILEVLRHARISHELILVDDASRDGTPEVIRRLLRDHPGEPLKAVFHGTNTGRGRAVADGIREAVGDIVGYLDVDLEVPPAVIPACCRAIREGADVAVGERSFAFVPRDILRRLLSRGYATLAHLLLPVGDLPDTEAGCKFFRRSTALPVVRQVEDPGWFWDTESVVRCHLAGLSIVPVPCVYTRDPAKPSSVRLGRDIAESLGKLLAFRRSLARIAPVPTRRMAP